MHHGAADTRLRDEGAEETCTSVAFVLIDGVGDVSIPELGHRTPLQAASTPTLDAVAGKYHA
jgi:2,3-bisphosphoglycerate-independent phosphoglycerate mutase